MKISSAIYNGKNEIKNIIFDWGGVLTDLHIEDTINAFKNIGLSAREEPDIFADLFIPFETGKISAEEFRNKIRYYAKNNVSDNTIDAAWNMILGELPAHRWNILEKANTLFRTFLLSNTNIIHQTYYFKFLKGIYGTDGFSHFFEKMYFSHELHMRKPNEDIFHYVINNAAIKVGETLFIDDAIENIETAHHLGFNTIHLALPLTLKDVFIE